MNICTFICILSQILAEEADIRDEPDAHTILIDRTKQKGATVEFRDVSFHYPAQTSNQGIKRITFTVDAGTTTAIVGPTGAGKSTIGRLLFRFYDTNDGDILIDGHPIKGVTQQSLRNTIGVVPQDTVMFNDDILYNVQYGRPGATKDEILSACEKAQILGFINSLPAKWETKVGERGLRLSGGEKQRVAIARTLLKDPPIVLLDEATSALDTVTEAKIQGALQNLGQGRTTLVIAHRLSTVRDAEQIIVLKDGNIHEKGTHDELLARQGLYADMWRQQIQESLKMKEGDSNKRTSENTSAKTVEESEA